MRARVIGRAADRSDLRHIFFLRVLLARQSTTNGVGTCATSRPTRSATSATPQAIETRQAAETSPVVRSALLAAKPSWIGPLAVNSCAPDQCYSLICLMPLSGSYPPLSQRLSSAERISPVRSRVTKPP